MHFKVKRSDCSVEFIIARILKTNAEEGRCYWHKPKILFFSTPGRSYAVSSQRMLHQCLESIVQKTQPGVVINFEKIGPDPPQLEG